MHPLPGFRFFPEPQEQRAYLVLLTAPLVLAFGTLLLQRALREHPTWSPRLLPAAVAGQVFLLLLVIPSGVAQIHIAAYFSRISVALALIAAVLCATAVVDPKFAAWLQAVTRAVRRRGRFTRAWTATVAGLATLAVTVGLYNEQNIGLAPAATWYHLNFTMEEYAAVLNGATPLVDFTPQYNFVLPYVLGPAFDGLGGVTTGTFTTVMTVFSWAALMSVYLAFRMSHDAPFVVLIGYLAFLAIISIPRLSSVVNSTTLRPITRSCPCDTACLS